ncbi:serine/threonine transporter SstT [Acinetobacter gerneri]|jgi:serine/threonine transporter|uniref:Serine/threonine transporter SstT n=2 Tax=Acinetobacter gerneri TaxID=202952 RepID=N8ZNG5_9GAMM|nr:serine/threonine transporter SstT [Acinetobacter gerneri]ENV33025.1 serine/threonine transporter sstT [Acinetobacter gerneri DSM 14967 = CIP 107464 = MTCC 9824]EPR80871.1 Sodium/dicarboxylate symporter [Acinetobacter gerneri DSM 14967 = CIP 107464 = MTCC 9824]MCH4244022.1 serine/threonine transporter SstT [Acinetobacter gerneri]MDQ9009655.1 serine/threonine transporter SstT [Acinetobacter gerneri]MDQ9013749.1 serine/threonine transporter SstT [Acinetobacter gerneri]
MFSALTRLSLVTKIIIAIVLGAIVAFAFPQAANYVGLLGDLFIKALKSVAPILVFVLVLSSIANFKVVHGGNSNLKPILLMYFVGMLLASISAVTASILFPSTLYLSVDPNADLQPPGSIAEVLKNLLLSFITNPVTALSDANFIGILAWAVGLGAALRHASDTTKQVVSDISDAVNSIIRIVISFAPVGIFGLVVVTFATAGLDTLKNYSQLILVLVGTMFFVALVINPILVAIAIRKNPYPLVLKCLRESGITAFFTRSSAANIPVNLDLAKRLGVNESTASVSIPLGATINMAGAAVTITVLTLAAVHTLHIETSFLTMLVLSVVAVVTACGASGVAGGSLLLIPVACGLFGIKPEIAMQVVAIGMVISVLQDSTETALNSSTDVLFTAAVDQAKNK